jgi:hypothetical protein
VKIEWLYLLAALLLLLPPAPFSSGVQKSLFSLRRNQFADALAAARVWQNWLDLVRAAAGVYLLTQYAIVTDGQTPAGEMQAVLVKAGILTLVLLAQTVRRFRTVQLLAPIFYLSGLTLVLGGDPFRGDYYMHGVFAVVVGWLFAVGGKKLDYQLPSMAVALAAAGYVLGLRIPLLLNCALILMPLVLGALFRRKLLFAASTPVST